MRKVISLENGSRVDIDGCNVRHVAANGTILYSTSGIEFFTDVPEKISYFFFMGEYEREKIRNWLKEIEPKTTRQQAFIVRVKNAIRMIDYDYKIATLEPSFDSEGKIFYKEGCPVAMGITNREWEEKAEEFYSDDEWHSELADIHEGDLFKAYRVVCNYWSLESICDDSNLLDKYSIPSNEPHNLELSGTRTIGGFKDGIGNAYHVYKTDMGYAQVGGRYIFPRCGFSAIFSYYTNIDTSISHFGTGVIVLKRNKK